MTSEPGNGERINGDELAIREMTPEDVNEVLAIERACFSSPWNKHHFLDHLRHRPLAQAWVADHDEDIVGYLIAWYIAVYLQETGEMHILNIAVQPARQRQGIGMALLLHAVEHGLAQQCETATLEVRESNRNAQAFYQRYGFTVSGRRRGYYGTEDALLMEASLSAVREAMKNRA